MQIWGQEFVSCRAERVFDLKFRYFCSEGNVVMSLAV